METIKKGNKPSGKVKKNKKTLRNKADRLYQEVGRAMNDKCEVCRGEYCCLHHFFPKSMSSALRYDLDNGIALCRGCHFRHHNGDPIIHETVIRQRGQDWYDKLFKKKVIVKTDVPFYENAINELNNHLINIANEKMDKNGV